MKCAACHSEMVQKTGEIDLRIEGRLYIARNVTFEVCEAGGEKVLLQKIAEDLYEKIRRGEFVEEAVRIRLLNGTYG